MKRIFLASIVLILSFQSLTKAEDVRNFEIEGISVGDSLLEYFSEETIIKNIKTDHIYIDDTFYDVEIYNLDLSSEFSNLSFNLKKNDESYKIYQLSGFMFFKNNVEECFKKVDEMAENISHQLKDVKNIERVDAENPHDDDPTGESKTKQTIFWHESGSLFTECYDWSDKITKEKGWTDNFSVGVALMEYDLWLNYKAYN
jgi:hypothetical protein